ncbi:MAG: hypothetical protein Q4B85_06240 [Lachnospiraceae bacterium]|nr:hypothetical protein [Lachnospiraceae bacterium]
MKRIIRNERAENRRRSGDTRPVIYELSAQELLRMLLLSGGISFFAVWICYCSLRALPVALPVWIFFFLCFYREAVNRHRQEMRGHFREYLTAVHMAVRSGYSLENAVRSGYRDTVLRYGRQDILCRELEQLLRQLEYRIPVEQLFRNLGRNTEIREIQSFAELISITKRTGGSLGKVLGDTWHIMTRRMDTQQEIETLLSARAYEQSVMSLMPAGMILYLRFAFPGFVEQLYGNGTGAVIMTCALLLYLGAFALGRWMVQVRV